MRAEHDQRPGLEPAELWGGQAIAVADDRHPLEQILPEDGLQILIGPEEPGTKGAIAGLIGLHDLQDHVCRGRESVCDRRRQIDDLRIGGVDGAEDVARRRVLPLDPPQQPLPVQDLGAGSRSRQGREHENEQGEAQAFKPGLRGHGLSHGTSSSCRRARLALVTPRSLARLH
jgi:hypothetical protein